MRREMAHDGGGRHDGTRGSSRQTPQTRTRQSVEENKHGSLDCHCDGIVNVVDGAGESTCPRFEREPVRGARECPGAWAALWRRATERLGVRTPLTLARLRAAGIPGGDVDAHAQVLELLADCLDSLPSMPAVPLPVLALQLSGDPHALDADKTCGRYLQLAAVELAGEWDDAREPDGVTVRRTLQNIGVIADRISSPTITYGLGAQTDSPLAALLEAAATNRTAVGICGAMLDRASPRFLQQRWLCVENQLLVELATLRACDGPIVCTAGWPSIDAQRLLDLACEQGIEMRYAGDYDLVGLNIAKFMLTRYEAAILMNRASYVAADLQRAPEWTREEAIPSTPWDSELAIAIREKRRIVYQVDPAVWQELLAEECFG